MPQRNIKQKLAGGNTKKTTIIRNPLIHRLA